MNYYHHSPLIEGQSRVTVAGILDGSTLTLGVSRCSKKDQFSKKKGRYIAEGRAKTKPTVIVEVPKDSIVGRIFLEESRKIMGIAIDNPQAVHHIQEQVEEDGYGKILLRAFGLIK